MTVYDKNPEEKASLLSYLTFWWVNDILKLGYEGPLETEDLFQCHIALKSKTLAKTLDKQWERQKDLPRPSFTKALFYSNKKTLFIIILATVLESVFLTVPSFMVGKISSYFEDIPEISTDSAILYASGLFCMNVLHLLLRSMLYWTIIRLAVAVRVSTSTLVYQKACCMKTSSVGKRSVGHIINLITNDSERIVDGVIPIHNIIHAPVTVIVAAVISIIQIGYLSTLTGFLALMSFVPLQIFLGRYVKHCRSRAAPQTDKRVKLIGEVISSMKVIKMYNWESTFLRLIQKIRDLEIKYIQYFSLISLSLFSIQTVSTIFALLVTLTIKYVKGETMSIGNAYFFISIADSLRNGVIRSITMVSKFVPQFAHSTKRIQDFLTTDDKDSDLYSSSSDTSDGSKARIIEISNVTSCWSKSTDSFTLQDISISVEKGQVVGIIGPVGAGKSSLIMTLVKEMDLIKGSIRVPEHVAFSSQIPWIFNGTMQENILFNRPLEKDRLHDVLHACYLYPDLEVLPNGLDTLVGERGVQLSGGQRARLSLARAVYGKEDIVLLDDPLSAVDTKCAHGIMNRLVKKFLSGKTILLVTHNVNYLQELDHIVVLKNGTIVEQGPWSKISNNLDNLVAGETTPGTVVGPGQSAKLKDVLSTSKSKLTRPKGEEDRKTGSISKATYFKFFALGFGPPALPLIVVFIAAAQTLKIISENTGLKWVRLNHYQDYYTFVILSVAAVFAYFLFSYYVVFVTMRSSKRLHMKCIRAVLKSPLRYFDVTPIGSIINRFSKDTFYMDEKITFSFSSFFIIFLTFSASMILMTIANYYFALILLPMMVLIGFITRFYLKTSVEIRRLESMQRSPAMSHISETLNGMCTIRSSNQLNLYQDKYYELRDNHTSANIIFLVLGRWLGQRLDFIMSILACAASVSAILLSYYRVLSPQLAGLAVVYIQGSIQRFQFCIRQGAECENLMTSIERMFSLSNLESEESKLNHKDEPQSYLQVRHNPNIDKEDLIQEGSIRFTNVSLRYDESLPWVIHGISFDIKPGEKIGIVGPTGAGKSSILQALYRLCETKGEIMIDNVDISQLSLFQLRSSLSVIPQESLLFSGTLKQNLDPNDSNTEHELWEVLEQVQLKDYVSGQNDGLHMHVEEMGRNLSVGQRQLVCLARALLKKCNILLIDECTANVDQDTDKMIQEMIRRSFADRTVLTIAHRLDTIIDSDRVMVMKNGEIVEFDAPQTLMMKQDSVFYDLYTQHRSMTPASQ